MRIQYTCHAPISTSWVSLANANLYINWATHSEFFAPNLTCNFAFFMIKQNINFFSSFFCAKWNENSNLFDTFVVCVILFMVFAFICMLCEPGEMMIDRFAKFEDELVQCEWYLLPIKVQSMYTIFVSSTQNPIKVASYGGIMCERETFKKVFEIKCSNILL